MKKLLLIVLVVVAITGCDKNLGDNPELDGAWIESVYQKDTLVFDNSSSMFTLYRGTEIRSGYVLPKSKSGPYMYEMDKDSIALRSMLSSSSYSDKYYFKVDLKNNEIKIGNFFVDSVGNNVVLTFKRLK